MVKHPEVRVPLTQCDSVWLRKHHRPQQCPMRSLPYVPVHITCWQARTHLTCVVPGNSVARCMAVQNNVAHLKQGQVLRMTPSRQRLVQSCSAVVLHAGQTKLFSLGADKRLIEYDLATCTAANTGLRALSIRDCVPPGGTGSPCAMCFAPPMPYYSHSSTETLLLVAGGTWLGSHDGCTARQAAWA